MKFACGTVACASVLGAFGPTAAIAEPFLVRNQHPIVALFGLPAPLPARLPAPGRGTAAALVNWSNFATTGTDGDLGYTLDGEVFETRLVVDHSLGARFALHGELAYRSLSAGSLDGAIDQWHDFFGLPSGSRTRLPDDQLLIEHRNRTATPLRVVGDASGLADIPLAVGYQWHASETDALATWLSVTWRSSGRTSPKYASPPNTASAISRKEMMAAGLNRSASRLEADRRSAMSVPATTMTAPRRARRRRQRFRTLWMTSRSSGRRSEGLNPSGM